MIFLLTFFQLQYLPFLLVFLFEILLARLNKSFSLNKLFDSNHTESLQSTLYDNLICLKTDADWERLMRYTDVLPFSPRLVVHTHTFNERFIGNSKRLVRIAFAMLTYTHTHAHLISVSLSIRDELPPPLLLLPSETLAYKRWNRINGETEKNATRKIITYRQR